MKRLLLPLALLAMLSVTGRAELPAEPGLYAVFTTNQGEFTCALFFEEVPITVANFVGLAEGNRTWIDWTTGQARSEPFYNGLTFHRVIENFMIQGGSRNGQGTDGPGYRFPDEFSPALTHDKKGILSMANSGFDTNGSQFFITVVPTDWLNYKHTVFGEVVTGMTVVEAISNIATDSGNRPLEPVVVHSVEIHRIGPSATAFNAMGHALPKIGGAKPTLTIADGNYTLRFPKQEQQEFVLSRSNDLQAWVAETIPLTEENPVEGSYNLTSLASGQNKQFYRLLAIDYTEVDYGFLPENLVGKNLQLNLSTQNTITLQIDDERTEENAGQPLGTGSVDDDAETTLDYLYQKENNRGRFLFILSGYFQINTDLKFIDEESGTFTGRIMMNSPFDVHGTFTLLPREATPPAPD